MDTSEKAKLELRRPKRAILGIDRKDRIDRIDRINRIDRIDRIDRKDRIDRIDRKVRKEREYRENLGVGRYPPPGPWAPAVVSRQFFLFLFYF